MREEPLQHEAFCDSIHEAFGIAVEKGNFVPPAKRLIRDRAQCMLLEQLAACLPDRAPVLRQRYVRELECSVYYMSSCCVDRRYRWKVLELIANLRRNGAYIVETFAPSAVSALPSLMLARGSSTHMRRVNASIETFKRQAMSRLEHDRLLSEIEIYRLRDPPRWEELSNCITEIHNGDYAKEELPDGIEACGRCGSRKTTHYSMQTRRADEGMTVFFACRECSHRWRC